MQARNRNINDWYGYVTRGEIKLPRFQRFEAWDTRRITSLMNTVTKNLPLGITLVLEVGDKEQFISRHLVSAPAPKDVRVAEQLLDGQQRLTALWRLLHNNYDYATFFVYVPEYDEQGEKESDHQFIFSRTRYTHKSQRYPLWCDDPAESLKRGMIPTHLLRPEDIQVEIDDWLSRATDHRKPNDLTKLEEFFNWKKSISDKIRDLRSVIKNYNLPFLALPSATPKEVALEVFINMNTNSKPLSQYDIIVAEIESIREMSLHDLQAEMDKKHPNVKRYFDLSYLLLNASALLQEKLPNIKGMWDMDKSLMVDNWSKMERGLSEMATFLYNEGILDHDRLPTNAVLAVIAALYPFVPETGDRRGACEVLLKKYLWSAFFTDRYENSAATHAYYDYIPLKRIITNAVKENGEPYTEADVPVLNRANFPIESAEELLSAAWSKRDSIRGRAVLAVACRLGAHDFATGQKVDSSNVKNRHYHHVYPDALLKEAGIDGSVALNCALILDNTNLNIGRKDPLKYLAERYKWVSQEVVHERLNSHLIPVKELANGGYEGLSEAERVAKIKVDYEAFLKKRGEYISRAAAMLADGRDITARDIISLVETPREDRVLISAHV